MTEDQKTGTSHDFFFTSGGGDLYISNAAAVQNIRFCQFYHKSVSILIMVDKTIDFVFFSSFFEGKLRRT